MSDMAKKARAAMKAKAKSLTANRPLERVDASTWTPPEPMNPGAKAGMRPISRTAFKSGGKVEGACAETNMGRKPRKSGGRALTADSLINRNVKTANEEREGIKHVGGMKSGGRAKKMVGGPMAGAQKMMQRAQAVGDVPGATMNFTNIKKGALSPLRNMKKGGKVHEDVAEDKALIKKMVKPSARTGKAEGGWTPNILRLADNKSMLESATEKPTFKTNYEKEATFTNDPDVLRKAKQQSADKVRAHGGRVARATGGRTRTKGKGKTNINIVIAAGKPAGAGDMMSNPMGGPTPPPGIPVPVPPAGGPPGGAPMPMPMPMPMPTPAPGGAFMPRKSGGRATSYKDMTAGAGSGEGRLQKTEIAEHQREKRKAGGKVYRSYKDMDAGAGSGLGRLEKTEIQARKG